MREPEIDGRHRTLLGRISRKHGSTVVSTLRAQHGQNFLPQFKATDDLANVLHASDVASLSQLEKHYPLTR